MSMTQSQCLSMLENWRFAGTPEDRALFMACRDSYEAMFNRTCLVLYDGEEPSDRDATGDLPICDFN